MNGLSDLGNTARLQKIATGSSADGFEDFIIILKHREDDDEALGGGTFLDEAYAIEATHAAHRLLLFLGETVYFFE